MVQARASMACCQTAIIVLMITFMCRSAAVHADNAPLWAVTNGDVYGRFSAPASWQSIHNVSQYSLLWNQGLPMNGMSGVVDANGILYAAVSCFGPCDPTPPPQPPSVQWASALSTYGGLAAVAPNGTLLWTVQPSDFVDAYGSVALLDGGSIVALSQIVNPDGATIVMYRTTDGAGYTMNNLPFTQYLDNAAFAFDDARSTFYVFQTDYPGVSLIAISWDSCGDLCMTFTTVWTSAVFPNHGSTMGLSRPVLTPDASQDVLAFDPNSCTLYRLQAATGHTIVGPVNVGAFPGSSGKDAHCNVHFAADPTTSQIIFAGLQRNSGFGQDEVTSSFITAVYGNGAHAWTHSYSPSWSLQTFAVGDKGVYAVLNYLVPFGQFSVNEAFMFAKYSTDGTEVYRKLYNFTSDIDFFPSLTVLGDYVGTMAQYNELWLLEEATGEVAVKVAVQPTSGGGAGGPRGYQPIIPGINGQLFSASHWFSFTANCIPEDLQQSYHEVCSFGGVCHEGACECLPGFLPPSCAECMPGHFGEGCSPCQCLGNSTCLGSGSRAGNGTCVCGSGFHGPDCATCNPGFTGPLCDDMCPVGPHGTICSGNGHCNQTVYGDGSCTCIQGFAPPSCSSCAEGYGGPGCSECLPGFAGSPCLPCPGSTIVNGTVTQVCTGHGVCENSGTTTSGVCKCSDDRFAGPGCSKCAIGFWGPDCSPCPRANGEICNEEGTCNGSGTQGGTGVCECTAGFTGPACDQCKPDHYGGFCQACPGLTSGDVCSGHGTCNQGINGDGSCNCSLLYSGNECSSCKNNRIYPNCTSCPPNAWGPTCSLCPSPGKYVCNKHGTCNGAGTIGGTGACKCDKGWGGDDCTSCGAGFWGYPDCQACPGEASGAVCGGHGQCSPSTGVCSCATGFTGSNCEECKSTYFGPSCQACPGSSGDSVCSGHGSCDSGVHGNGTCSCTHPYSGSACSECASCKPSSNTWTYAIVGGAGGIVVLLGGVFWLAQRRKKQRRSSGSARPLLDSTAEATDPELAKKQHDQA